jgi:ATPase subunit of ABC transporter with duplicated ATPase domains
MKTILRIAVATIALVMMLLVDVPLLPVQPVPEAQAIFGTRRRTAVVVGSSVHAADSAQMAQSQQQAAAAQQQAAAAEKEAEAAKKEAAAAKQEAEAAKKQAAAAPPAPAPAAAGKPLPLGTVVSALPAGCVATPVGGVEYYYCGGNFYRAVFQGNQLVYVTAQPK